MRRFFLLTFFVMLSLINLSKAGVSSEVLNIINTTVSSVPPGYYKTAERGYVGLGSLSMRNNAGDLRFSPFSFTAPQIRTGCGAIDIAMGGFAFLNTEYLVAKLQSIMQAAPAFAFQLAIETFSPQVGNIISKLEAVADAINNINFNACSAAKNFVAMIKNTPNLSQDSSVAGNQLASGFGNFWDRFKNVLGINDQINQLKSAWDDLSNNLSSYFSSTSTSNQGIIQVSNGIYTIRSIFGKCNNWEGLAKHVEAARPNGLFLRYYDTDGYKLKVALLGEPNLNPRIYSQNFSITGCNGASPSKDLISILESLKMELLNASKSNSQSSYSFNIAIMDGENVSINLSTFINETKNAIRNYRQNIINNTPLSSKDVSYINLVAIASPEFIRLLRYSALLGEGSETDSASDRIITLIAMKAFITYLRGVLNEGFAEGISALNYGIRSIKDLSIYSLGRSSSSGVSISPIADHLIEIMEEGKRSIEINYNERNKELISLEQVLNDLLINETDRFAKLASEKERILKDQLKRNNLLKVFSYASKTYF